MYGFRLFTVTLLGALTTMAATPTRVFEAVPLETVSETSANAGIGDVNGDGIPDIVLAKGRHWPLKDVVLLGDGKGHFTPGPELPNPADRSYTGALADLDRDGDMDIVISNDRPDPKIILLNDGKGHFIPGGTFGDPKWPTPQYRCRRSQRGRRPRYRRSQPSGPQPDLHERWQSSFCLPPAGS